MLGCDLCDWFSCSFVFGCRFFPYALSLSLSLSMLSVAFHVFALNTVYLLECECCLSIVDKVHYSYLVTHIRYSPVVFDYICAFLFFSFFLFSFHSFSASMCAPVVLYFPYRDVSVLFSSKPNFKSICVCFAVRTQNISLNNIYDFIHDEMGCAEPKCDPVSDWTLSLS